MPHAPLRLAIPADAPAIEALLNLCYRSDGGWTNEAALVGGIRTTLAEVQDVIQAPERHLLVAEHLLPGSSEPQLAATICIEPHELNGQTTAYVGMFAVHPALQGAGLGKTMLEAVEQYAQSQLKLHTMSMTVLEGRPELTAYYQRRGYQPTGESIPFPDNELNGTPLKSGMRMHYMIKEIA